MSLRSTRNAGVSPAVLLPPVPVPMPPWVRALIYIVETVASGIIWQQFDYATEMQPTGGDASAGEADTWRKFVMHYENTLSADTADDQIFTIDIVNVTNGSVDNTWDDGDYTTVGNHLNTLASSLAPVLAPYMSYKGLAAYIRAFNPYGNIKPFADSGSPEYADTTTLVSTGGGNCPPQVCSTITEMTPSRAHWGRFYSPTLAVSVLDGAGRLTSAAVNAMVTAAATCYFNLMEDEFFPVVPVTQVTSSGITTPVRALQVVNAVRVDDVADVHRSRRFKNTNLRVTSPLPSEEPAQQPSSFA